MHTIISVYCYVYDNYIHMHIYIVLYMYMSLYDNNEFEQVTMCDQILQLQFVYTWESFVSNLTRMIKYCTLHSFGYNCNLRTLRKKKFFSCTPCITIKSFVAFITYVIASNKWQKKNIIIYWLNNFMIILFCNLKIRIIYR